MIQARFARKGNSTPSAWLFASLAVCCLIPRLAAALRLDAVCNDAVFYVDLARHYERGDLAAGLGRLGLNVYPPVLAALHRLGVGWEEAGKWWGVAAASLAVFPLYGWVRRQFDGRTGLAAAVLYAFHPKLVDWSPELLRDPTFWFLWTLGLYASWRAATETALRWFLVAGLAIAVAAHTRFEGWFLYIPLLGWSASRCWQAAAGAAPDRAARWKKSAAGVLACLAVSPLLVVLVNVTLLRGLPRWELGNFERLDYVAQWLKAARSTASPPGPAPQAVQPDGPGESSPVRARDDEPTPVAAAVVRMPTSKMARLYGNALRRGFGALFGVLWVVGIVVGRRRLFRLDHAILFLVAACIAAAAWIHLWYGQATSSRYFLAVVLLACPCSAIGGLWIYDRLLPLFAVLPSTSWRQPVATAALIVMVVAAAVGESLGDRHDGRSREGLLGRWLLGELGPSSRIVTVGPMPRVGFYACTTPRVLSPAEAVSIDPAGESGFDALVALRSGANQPWLEPMAERMRNLGFQAVDHRGLPPGHDWTDLVLLTRRPKTTRGACRNEVGEVP